MGQLLIRDLDDAVIKTLTHKAKCAGLSLEEHVRALLVDEIDTDRERFLRFAEAMRGRSRKAYKDVTEMIREDRDR
jgi:plasmid stability protein